MPDRPDLRGDLNDDALVVRFEQEDAARVRKKIVDHEKLYAKRFDRADMHVLSCFIDVEGPGETEADLRRRLVTEALSVGAPANNGPVWLCRVRDLDTKGLRIIKDDLHGEAEHHYCLDFQERPSRERVEDFMQVFRRSMEEQ